MFDYVPGSATASYENYCKNADERAAQYPDNPKAKEAAERYKYEIGTWINKSNASGANHVSWAIAGPSNYNMRAHEKFMRREDKLMEEYNEINSRFESAMHGAAKPVIHDADPDALDQLKAKLAKEEAEHAAYIEHNKQARKEGKETLPAYVLQNSNGRLKVLRDRIAHVEKMQTRAARKQEFDGGYIEENTEAGRTQIFFDSKPDEETRNKLKSNGWRWSPSFGAWQRQLTSNAWYDATHLMVKVDL